MVSAQQDGGTGAGEGGGVGGCDVEQVMHWIMQAGHVTKYSICTQYGHITHMVKETN
jgi:hypothetical protein